MLLYASDVIFYNAVVTFVAFFFVMMVMMVILWCFNQFVFQLKKSSSVGIATKVGLPL